MGTKQRQTPLQDSKHAGRDLSVDNAELEQKFVKLMMKSTEVGRGNGENLCQAMWKLVGKQITKEDLTDKGKTGHNATDQICEYNKGWGDCQGASGVRVWERESGRWSNLSSKRNGITKRQGAEIQSVTLPPPTTTGGRRLVWMDRSTKCQTFSQRRPQFVIMYTWIYSSQEPVNHLTQTAKIP